MDQEANGITNDLEPEPTEPPSDVFQPRLTLTSRRIYSRKQGVNFHRLYIGTIDFGGDKGLDLSGITIKHSGGILSPSKLLPGSLYIASAANGELTLDGQAEEEHPYAIFDLFPDGFNQAGKVSIERDGYEPVEAEFEFNPSPLNWLFDVVESLIWAFFIAMIIRLFFFQTFYIPSGSMEPTLYEGDRIVANKLIYKLRRPKHGEVIIFRVYNYFDDNEMENEPSRIFMPGGRASFTKNDALGDRFMLKDYIKRVAGLPGDEVQITDEQLYVNGEPVDEPWITDPKYDFNYDYGPEIVPDGNLFVIGDNHRNSQDSHKLGYLPIENVVGEAMFVFYPFKNIKLIR